MRVQILILVCRLNHENTVLAICMEGRRINKRKLHDESWKLKRKTFHIFYDVITCFCWFRDECSLMLTHLMQCNFIKPSILKELQQQTKHLLFCYTFTIYDVYLESISYRKIFIAREEGFGIYQQWNEMFSSHQTDNYKENFTFSRIQCFFSLQILTSSCELFFHF